MVVRLFSRSEQFHLGIKLFSPLGRSETEVRQVAKFFFFFFFFSIFLFFFLFWGWEGGLYVRGGGGGGGGGGVGRIYPYIVKFANNRFCVEPDEEANFIKKSHQ